MRSRPRRGCKPKDAPQLQSQHRSNAPTAVPLRRSTDPDDPRDRVTPDDLNVAPELLGAPLARPARRLLAIAIDVAILAALSKFGNVWLLAGFGLIALVHLRDPLASAAPRRQWLSLALAVALIGFGAQQAWVNGLVRDDAREAADDAREAADDARERAEDAQDAREAAAEKAALAIVKGLTAAGPASQPSSEAGKPTDKQMDKQAANQAPQGLVVDGTPVPTPALTPLQAAEVRISLLQHQLTQARKPKPFNLGKRILSWADEVGLGLGWAIVYFAVLPVWWNGQTVGKRLLRLRVVELTGKPITAMRAFKRYGGYAAGMATGMFGFAQVLWDPNRQAIQDKTAHTVVIDLRRKLRGPFLSPSPPPSPEEPR